MKYFEIEDFPFNEVETATGYKSIRIDIDKDGIVFEREPAKLKGACTLL